MKNAFCVIRESRILGRFQNIFSDCGHARVLHVHKCMKRKRVRMRSHLICYVVAVCIAVCVLMCSYSITNVSRVNELMAHKQMGHLSLLNGGVSHWQMSHGPLVWSYLITNMSRVGSMSHWRMRQLSPVRMCSNSFSLLACGIFSINNGMQSTENR